MSTRNRVAWVIVFLAPLLAGCGTDEIKLHPVVGTVKVKGKPLAGAAVSFRADPDKGNTTAHVPSSATDAEGKFELTTNLRKGAPAGWYKVAVFPPLPPAKGAELPTLTSWPYDKSYGDPKTTDLRIEVKAGTPPGGYDLQLDR